MEFFDVVRNRRAVNHYDKEYRISDKDIRYIVENAMLSPTAFNIQHWRFLLVHDKQQRIRLRDIAGDQIQVTDASHLIVLCADTKAWSKSPERYWTGTSKNVSESMVSMIKEFYEGEEVLERDEAIRSCGISAQTLMLSAKALGYDTCPMIGFDLEKAAEIINLPHDFIIGMFVTIGKKVKEAYPCVGKLSFDDVVFYDSF